MSLFTDNQPDNQIDNIEKIRYLNSLLLQEAYLLIKEGCADDKSVIQQAVAKKTVAKKKNPAEAETSDFPDKKITITTRHTQLWGKNEAVVDALASIAETELKIEKQRSLPSSGKTSELSENHHSKSSDSPPLLDEKDIALVRHYLQREKALSENSALEKTSVEKNSVE